MLEPNRGQTERKLRDSWPLKAFFLVSRRSKKPAQDRRTVPAQNTAQPATMVLVETRTKSFEFSSALVCLFHFEIPQSYQPPPMVPTQAN